MAILTLPSNEVIYPSVYVVLGRRSKNLSYYTKNNFLWSQNKYQVRKSLSVQFYNSFQTFSIILYILKICIRTLQPQTYGWACCYVSLALRWFSLPYFWYPHADVPLPCFEYSTVLWWLVPHLLKSYSANDNIEI